MACRRWSRGIQLAEDLDPHVGELLDELELLHPVVDLKDFFRFSGAGVRMKRNVIFCTCVFKLKKAFPELGFIVFLKCNIKYLSYF